MERKQYFNRVFEIDQTSSQDKVLLALLESLKKQPFSAISVAGLCKKAGISRNTFYKYFDDKNAVLDCLAEELNLAYNHYTPPEGHQGDHVRQSWLHYFNFWYCMREWVEVLVKNGLWEQVVRPTRKMTEMISPRAWNPYIGEHPEIKQMMFDFISAGGTELVRSWCLNGFAKSPAEMAELVSYITSGDLKNAVKL